MLKSPLFAGVSAPRIRALSRIYGACLALGGLAGAACSQRSAVPNAPVWTNPAPLLNAPAPSGGSIDEDAAARAAWTMDVDDGGTVRVSFRGTRVLTFHYLFWGKNNAWADPVVRSSTTSGGVTRFELAADALGLRVTGTIAKTGPGELRFEYTLEGAKDLNGIDGGGLEFNLNLDAVASGGQGPVLLPDRRGFHWDTASPDGITVAFDAQLPATYFEQGQKNTVRCFLVGSQLRAAPRKVAMTVRLPQGGLVRRSADERYGAEDRAGWYRDTLPWDRWPVDVSFLNEKPAGQHGRVKADGERLAFDDGTPIRFWGTNIHGDAIFQSSKEEVALQAKRLAALGYNLVRIVQHDAPWVRPNVFDPFSGGGDKLDARSLDRIDWWVKCLKDEGIYVWMDLHVGRQFSKGDGIDGYAELSRQQGSCKGFCYVNPSVEKAMQKFGDRYLLRINPYTGKRYNEEPALAALLLTNENDVTFHHGAAAFSDKTNPVHGRLFQALARRLASRMSLPVAASLDVAAPGPSKIVLTEIEHLFYQRAFEHLRASGFASLLVPTSFWGAENMTSLPSLATGDMIDVHSYGAAESLGVNPRYESNFISWIGAAQVAGKPLSISEWNVEYPHRDRFVAPLYMAAIASLQGWDAPMIFSYAQGALHAPDHPDARSTWNDPAITATMPAAAVLFRAGHVREATKTYRIDLTRENVYYERTSPESSAAMRTLVEQSKLTIGLPDIPELAWDGALSSRSSDAVAVSDLGRDFLPVGQNVVVSDTGQLRRDWAAGVQTIDAPSSQAVLGWVGKRHIDLHDVSFDIATPKAAVSVTSLDGQPIAASKQILVTAVAQVAPTQGGDLPFLAQPVEATITVRSSVPLRLVPLPPGTYPYATPPIVSFLSPMRRGTEQIFTLPRGVATHWFMLLP